MKNNQNGFVNRVNVIGLLIAAIVCILGGIYLFAVKKETSGLFLILAGVVILFGMKRAPKP